MGPPKHLLCLCLFVGLVLLTSVLAIEENEPRMGRFNLGEEEEIPNLILNNAKGTNIGTLHKISEPVLEKLSNSQLCQLIYGHPSRYDATLKRCLRSKLDVLKSMIKRFKEGELYELV
eukprot:Filipodium_phascolosomae@DN5457_c0_g1_i1.p1